MVVIDRLACGAGALVVITAVFSREDGNYGSYGNDSTCSLFMSLDCPLLLQKICPP